MKYTKQDYIQLFHDADLDKSRAIDAKELIAFLKKNKMNPDENRVKKYFSVYDKSKNGVLELPEFIELMEAIFYNDLM